MIKNLLIFMKNLWEYITSHLFNSKLTMNCPAVCITQELRSPYTVSYYHNDLVECWKHLKHHNEHTYTVANFLLSIIERKPPVFGYHLKSHFCTSIYHFLLFFQECGKRIIQFINHSEYLEDVAMVWHRDLLP